MNAVIPRTGPSQRAELICLMMHAYKCYLRTLLNRLFGVRIRLWNASACLFRLHEYFSDDQSVHYYPAECFDSTSSGKL